MYFHSLGFKFSNILYQIEYNFVKEKYIPWIVKKTRLGLIHEQSSKIFMDLGHSNLYFIDALVDYLIAETNYRFKLVRIVRPRYETAVSLSEDKWVRRRGCGMVKYSAAIYIILIPLSRYIIWS